MKGHNYGFCRKCGVEHIHPWVLLGRGPICKDPLRKAHKCRIALLTRHTLPSFQGHNKGRCLKCGGEHLERQGYLHSKETKQRISEALSLKPNLAQSPALAYILGVIKGDGCVSNNSIYLNTIDKAFAESFVRALDSIGLRPKLHFNSNCWRVFAGSVIFYKWYKPLAIADIGLLIKHYPEDFIRGFYESEGTILGPLGVIQISNTSSELIKLCENVLRELGFQPKLYRSNALQVKTGEYFKLCLQDRIQAGAFISLIKPCIKFAPRHKIKELL